MKKLGILILSALLLPLFTYAEEDSSKGPGWGKGRGMRGGGGRMRWIKELNLSEEQLKKIKEIRKAHREEMRDSREAKRQQHEEFQKANQLLTFVLNRAKKMETRKRARVLDKKLVNTMSMLWKRRHREAQEYAEVGNFRAARDIYSDIEKKFLSKYSKLAAEQLQILKDRE